MRVQQCPLITVMLLGPALLPVLDREVHEVGQTMDSSAAGDQRRPPGRLEPTHG